MAKKDKKNRYFKPMPEKIHKTIPERVYKDGTVFMKCEDDFIPLRVLRKSPNSLVLKTEEREIKRAFWSKKSLEYKVEGKYLILN